METKELDFNGFKMNGFVALFLHLVVFSAIIVFGFIIGVGRSVPLMFFSMLISMLSFILFAG